MNVTISNLKSHIVGWSKAAGLAIDSELVKAVATFTVYVEGKQAEADAVALLRSLGYGVFPPAAEPAQPELATPAP